MSASTGSDGDWVQDLAWPEVERRLRAGAIALLPIGAASKEHGPHLPHGTDYLQAAHYAAALAGRIDALIWPVASYGYYPVFTDYPGSVSLRAETFTALVGEILEGIAGAGARAAILVNTGISTIAPLEGALNAWRAAMPVRLLNCYAGPRFRAAVAAVEEQPWGGHADEIETALMLAIAPATVHMEHAVAADTHIARGRFNRTDACAPNYSPSGVNGDPTRATRAKGERLLAALLDDLYAGACDALRD